MFVNDIWLYDDEGFCSVFIFGFFFLIGVVWNLIGGRGLKFEKLFLSFLMEEYVGLNWLFCEFIVLFCNLIIGEWFVWGVVEDCIGGFLCFWVIFLCELVDWGEVILVF